ncbi:(2Fe-2S)-binding protein [Phycicoccus duodecadis]|uniref:FhuF-like iron-sulfur protein n=1 Tax=Phycicoccus duodecadis TaxID=173053 RepID=A0A2N3YM42_9MICO|nr:(2Fe-2S)-binding protein [Phycicoccus duodecadis]PKW27906.1 FhuF-like iron-sulfur protein [Phycicoccus duodecadis]
MSARHAWLTFRVGPRPLEHPLTTTGALDWAAALSRLHARWYDGAAPPAVAAVFVLQWLLQVPAHTAAHAAAAGPWRVRDLAGLTFSRGGSLVPDVVALPGLVADRRDLAGRLDAAEADYRAVAGPIAAEYPSRVRLGAHTRTALVDDMWHAARREAEAATGRLAPGVLPRASCCLIYALPGCAECAGCPRLSAPPVPRSNP